MDTAIFQLQESSITITRSRQFIHTEIVEQTGRARFNNVIASIKQIFANHPQISKVILYGSRAKGNYRSGSDIDFTFFGEGLNQSIMNKVSCELDDLLLPYTFDLSIFQHIENPDLIAHIERVGKVFYSRYD